MNHLSTRSLLSEPCVFGFDKIHKKIPFGFIIGHPRILMYSIIRNISYLSLQDESKGKYYKHLDNQLCTAFEMQPYVKCNNCIYPFIHMMPVVHSSAPTHTHTNTLIYNIYAYITKMERKIKNPNRAFVEIYL